MRIKISQGYDNIYLEVETVQHAVALLEAIMPCCDKNTTFSFSVKKDDDNEEDD